MSNSSFKNAIIKILPYFYSKVVVVSKLKLWIISVRKADKVLKTYSILILYAKIFIYNEIIMNKFNTDR